MKDFIYQYFNDFKPYKGFWCYEDGILLKAAFDLYESTKDEFYKNFALNYLDKFVSEDGIPKDYKLEDYSTDDVESGFSLFNAIKYDKKDKYLKAIELLRSQLKTHPRCDCGNFFHKLKYTYQVWMDGLYMALPFYLTYGIKTRDKSIIDDSMNQFRTVRKYLFDEDRKLYVHAYDEKRVMDWSDHKTGKAPNVWSRACGWMAMALIDSIEIIRNDYKDYALELFNQLKELIDGIIPHLDKNTKMVYQVVDSLDKKNYMETSGTAMIAYSIIKAYNLKLVDKSYLDLALNMYDGIVNTYFKKENDKYYLDGICVVAGLDNNGRNGTKEYYYSEKTNKNEVKGVAPFFMLYSEIIKAGK